MTRSVLQASRLLGTLMLCSSATAHAAGPLPDGQTDPETGEWNFEARLDGRLIGTHRFVVSGSPEAREVMSRADFVVRLLGIPVYRYHHLAQEHWQGNCLRDLQSKTDDDGTPKQVEQHFETQCVMSFAYWNPHLLTQQQLVDPQTGRVEPVKIAALPDAQIVSATLPVLAHGWRLQTTRQDISVWYAANGGRWIGLDAKVSGGRMLSYRLPPLAPHEKAPP